MLPPFSFLKAGAPPATYTQVFNATDATAFTLALGDSAPNHYVGLYELQDTVDRTWGKVEFKISRANGSIIGKTFTARLWLLATSGVPGGATPAGALYQEKATSTAVICDANWDKQIVPFFFPVPFTQPATTKYAITCDQGAPDAENNSFLFWNSNGAYPSPPNAGRGWWNTSLAPTGNTAGYAVQSKLYTTP